MIEEIDKLRQNLDIIDNQLQTLFLKRMKIVAKIKELKIINHLPIKDQTREDQIMEKIYSSPNKLICDYYSRIQKVLLEISNDYQNN